jgi:membrane protein implicated in regulation of membrane protease activity
LNYSSPKRGFPAGNPIANALVIVVGAIAIGASIVLGFFAFVVLSSIVLIFAAIVGIRLWWFNRKLQKAGGQSEAGERGPGSRAGVIEGEYRVVVEEQEDSQP